MNIIDAIYNRHSVRRYTDKPVSEEQLQQLIFAATRAPSAKNRQPWFFYLISDKSVKKELINTLNNGIDSLHEQYREKAIPRPDILSAKNSLRAMEQASALILVKCATRYDTYHNDGVDWPLHALDIEVTDLLSIGAAIQNILLAAEEMNLGSLWICDIFYAYPSLIRFLNEDAPIVSAVCIGYPDEYPGPGIRRPVKEVSAILSKKGE